MKHRFLRTAVAALAVITGFALLPGVSLARSAPVRPIPLPVNPLVAADRAADSGFDALAKGPNETFVRRTAVRGSGGFNYMSYDRTYRGLPVIGGDAVVVTDARGAVRGTASAIGRGVQLASLTPAVSAESASALARKQLDSVADSSPARLVVFSADKSDRLAFETFSSGTRKGLPSRLRVYVDAQTGSILDLRDDVRLGTGNGFYNGTVTISTSGSGASFSMQDNTRSGLRCGGQNGATFTGTDDNWGNGAGTNLETACVDALYAVQKEWDMLGAWLGRNGINGNGSGFPARVGLADVNAFWNGSFTNFGHSSDNQRQATSIDVVAHEFGHAIFQTTPGGAGSGNENGGLNESTGDIFGALTEHFAANPNDPPDYLVGEEVNLAGGGPIRNMFNPAALGDPSCFSAQIPNTEVHAAAGPNNHWFYLVAQGSGGNPSSPTCNGSSVSGIGIQKAGQIYMAALNMKTSTWRYVNVRTATLRAAVNLFGAASQECRTVKAAWDAVSVPAQAGEAQCTTGPGNDFSLTVNPGSGTVQTGGSTTTTVSTATVSGAAQTVSLSASGLGAGVTANFSPASVTSGGSSTLTLSASATAATGTRTVTITGTGTSATHTATYVLTVTGTPGGNDFSLSLTPASATVAAGSSTSSTVGTATVSGSPQTVSLAVSGAPTGVTASVTPASVTSGGSATLSIAVAATVPAGTYMLTVTGTGPSATHAATFTLTVTGGGGGCGGLPAWSPTTPYVPDDLVSHNGHRWKATWWSTGAQPGAPESWAVWADQGAC